MSTEKPSILHIAPTPFFSDRGCHIRIEGIVRCLAENGFDSLVCTYHHGREIDAVETARIKPIRAYTQTEAGPSKYKLWADWRLLWLSFKHFRKLKPVAIHAHLHEGVLIGWILKMLFFWRRTPLIADIQGSLSGELIAHDALQDRGLLYRLTIWMEKFLLRVASFVICSSEHSLGLMAIKFSVPKGKIALAQDGADAVDPLADDRRAELIQELSLPPKKALAIYSGALLDSKGLSELKTLISDCKDVADQVHFLIVGYPTEQLETFLGQHGLEQNCTLTGRVNFENLPELLALADIAIDPKNTSAGEGSGKMVNYLAAGLPVVAFDTTNNARFLPSGSPLAVNQAQLEGQLKMLLLDSGLRADFSEQNRRHFEANYSWEITREQLKEIYQQLLAG